MFRAHIGAQFSILIIPHFTLFCKCRAKTDFWPFTFGIGFAGCSLPPQPVNVQARRHKSEQFGLKLIIKN